MKRFPISVIQHCRMHLAAPVLMLFLITLFGGLLHNTADSAAEKKSRMPLNELLSQDYLNAQPVSGQDDTEALRWEYRNGNQLPARLDIRWNFRLNPVLRCSEPLGCDCDEAVLLLTELQSLQHDEAFLTFYRRIWRHVLPTRAGPGSC